VLKQGYELNSIHALRDHYRCSYATMRKILKKNQININAQHKNTVHKRTQTNLSTYGVEHSAQSPEIKEKTKQANIEKWGHEWPNQNETQKQKLKDAQLAKYGGWFAQVHNLQAFHALSDFDWLYTQYIVNHKSTLQIAKELDVSGSIVICNYLRQFNIALRKIYKFSYQSIAWLEHIMYQENVHIQHAENGGEYNIPNTRYKVDGYCQETNTVYEFYGDFWHGNPSVFESNFFNAVCYKTAGELYIKTLERERIITQLGYNLVTMWESQWERYNM
jgi:hypothetical protein